MFSLTLCMVWFLFGGIETANPVVSVGSGSYIGTEGLSETGKAYYSFLGIKYATASRFEKPVIQGKITAVYNATSYGPACVQKRYNLEQEEIYGEEDCLFLNIFTSSYSTQNTKPVLVWIHGGGFIAGSAREFDGSSIINQTPVVLVTIQYRLGPFGFLSTLDKNCWGNFGLWDQHTALQWIKQNIRFFGGDPDRVTIIGVSAGSASVAYHSISPVSHGLFHRAIMQSGSVTSTWAFKNDPLPVTYELARRTNCYPQKVDRSVLHLQIVDCLRRVPFSKLEKYSSPMLPPIQIGYLDFNFVPTKDDDFVPGDPHKLLRDRAFLNSTVLPTLDCMISVNNAEGGILTMVIGPSLLNASAQGAIREHSFFRNGVLLPSILQMSISPTDDILDSITHEYLYPAALSQDPIDMQSAFDLTADTAFVVPAVQFARMHAGLQGIGKTYFYYFDHYPSFSPDAGMNHGMDILYTFGFPPVFRGFFGLQTNATIPQAERNLSRMLIESLGYFAASGDPSPAVYQNLPGGWPMFEKMNESYVVMTNNMTTKKHLLRRRVSLWLDLVPKLARNSQNVCDHVITSIPEGNPSFKIDRFNMDAKSAEMTIIGLIVAVCVLGVLVIAVIFLACKTKRQQAGNYI